MPSEGFSNGGNEVSGKSGLYHVPERTDVPAGLDEFGIGVSRQENDLCGGAGVHQLPAGLYAVEDRHRYICYDDVGLKTLRGFEQALAVRNAPNNFAR